MVGVLRLGVERADHDRRRRDDDHVDRGGRDVGRRRQRRHRRQRADGRGHHAEDGRSSPCAKGAEVYKCQDFANPFGGDRATGRQEFASHMAHGLAPHAALLSGGRGDERRDSRTARASSSRPRRTARSSRTTASRSRPASPRAHPRRITGIRIPGALHRTRRAPTSPPRSRSTSRWRSRARYRQQRGRNRLYGRARHRRATPHRIPDRGGARLHGALRHEHPQGVEPHAQARRQTSSRRRSRARPLQATNHVPERIPGCDLSFNLRWRRCRGGAPDPLSACTFTRMTGTRRVAVRRVGADERDVHPDGELLPGAHARSGDGRLQQLGSRPSSPEPRVEGRCRMLSTAWISCPSRIS